MAEIKLIDRIKQGVFFVDGAMGTELFNRGASLVQLLNPGYMLLLWTGG